MDKPSKVAVQSESDVCLHACRFPRRLHFPDLLRRDGFRPRNFPGHHFNSPYHPFHRRRAPHPVLHDRSCRCASPDNILLLFRTLVNQIHVTCCKTPGSGWSERNAFIMLSILKHLDGFLTSFCRCHLVKLPMVAGVGTFILFFQNPLP